jgi:hypothetical protein
MKITDQVRFAAVATTLLIATSLSAQRYQGHDHHVYHAPVQTKQQTGPSSHAHAASASTAANNAGHGVNTASSQPVSSSTSSSSSKAPALPPGTNEHQPQ